MGETEEKSMSNLDLLETFLDGLEEVVDRYGEKIEAVRGDISRLNRQNRERRGHGHGHRIPMEKRPLMPSRGTAWWRYLVDLAERFGSGTFTSKSMPRMNKHYITRLHNSYRALEVVQHLARLNIYRINPEVLEALEKVQNGDA